MASGWPEVGGCDQVAQFPSSRLGHVPGCLAPEPMLITISVYLLISLRAPTLIPEANRVVPGAPNSALNSATAARPAPPNVRPLKSVMSKPGSRVFYQLLRGLSG